MDSFLGTLPELEAEEIDTLLGFFAQGGTLQGLLEVTTEDMDTLYAYTNQLFEAGDYIGAKPNYMALCLISHWQFEYWLALGMCCQRLGEHEKAVKFLAQAGLIRIDDPRPTYLIGISHQFCQRLPEARKAFLTALTWCGSKPEYAELKADILAQPIVQERIENVDWSK